MACRLNGAKPLSEPMQNIVNWTLGNKLQRNFNRNSNIFIEENTYENFVCGMLFISSRPQCVNSLWHVDAIWCQVNCVKRHNMALKSWSPLDKIMAWGWSNGDIWSIKSSGRISMCFPFKYACYQSKFRNRFKDVILPRHSLFFKKQWVHRQIEKKITL